MFNMAFIQHTALASSY